MKSLQRTFLVSVLAASAMVLSGCPLLFVGSMGYTGYQYHEKEGVFAPGQALGGPGPEVSASGDKNGKSSSSSSSSSSTSTSKPPAATNNNIE